MHHEGCRRFDVDICVDYRVAPGGQDYPDASKLLELVNDLMESRWGV